MQKIIAELCAISASRKADANLVKQMSTLNYTSDQLLARERVRSQKQKTNLMILKKSKWLDGNTREQILYLIFQMIANLDQEISNQIRRDVHILKNNDEAPEFGELGINDLIQMIQRFAQSFGIKNDRLKTIIRPNNANILADFVDLVSRVAKQKLKKTLFEIDDPSHKIRIKQQEPMIITNEPKKLKVKKMYTEVTHYKTKINHNESSKLTSLHKKKNSQNCYRVVFQREHKQYMNEMRKQFMDKFDRTLLEQKCNEGFIELMYLNEGNHEIIHQYLSKCEGQKSPTLKLKNYDANLYSNDEKKLMFERVSTESQEINGLDSMPSSSATSKQLKNYRNLYLQKMTEFNNVKRSLQKIQERPINEWLKLTLKIMNSIEFPLRLNYIGDKKLKQKQSNQSASNPNIADFVEEDVRRSVGDQINLSTNLRFKKQIIGCFSRKKIKEVLEGGKISPSKKQTLSSVQRCNTTVILPYLPINNGNRFHRDDSEKKLINRQGDGHLLSQMLQRKIQSNPETEEKGEQMRNPQIKKKSTNQSIKLPCSIIQF